MKTKSTEELIILESIPHLRLHKAAVSLDPSLALVRLDIPWPRRKKFVWELLDAMGYISVSSWAHD